MAGMLGQSSEFGSSHVGQQHVIAGLEIDVRLLAKRVVDDCLKQTERKARHIEEGYEERGVPKEEAGRRACATVSKEFGGGNLSGSGRGVADTHVLIARRPRSQVGQLGAAPGRSAQGLGHAPQARRG